MISFHSQAGLTFLFTIIIKKILIFVFAIRLDWSLSKRERGGGIQEVGQIQPSTNKQAQLASLLCFFCSFFLAKISFTPNPKRRRKRKKKKRKEQSCVVHLHTPAEQSSRSTSTTHGCFGPQQPAPQGAHRGTYAAPLHLVGDFLLIIPISHTHRRRIR